MKGLNLLFACAFCAISINSATIHVPGDQPTIQAAVDIAVNRDTVLVAPGTYAENVYDSVLHSDSIVIQSSGGPDVTSVIPPTGPAFYSALARWIIDGFTIRISSGTGVGVHARRTTVTVQNCDIGFVTTAIGYGTHVLSTKQYSASIDVLKESQDMPLDTERESTHSHERAWPEPGVIGCDLHDNDRAIYVTLINAHIRVSGNVIERNNGGLHLIDAAADVDNNKFRANGSGITHAAGVGIFTSTIYNNEFMLNETAIVSSNYDWADIYDNTFVDNVRAVRDKRGCAIHNNLFCGSSEYAITVSWNGSGADIYNNTITGNAIGIVCSPDVAVTITANIVVNNLEGIVPEAATLDCNDVWNNVSYNDPGPNGISLDPLFCNPSGECDLESGDFGLDPLSPCLPANNPCGVLMGALAVGWCCCVEPIRGNVDGDGSDAVNVADLTYLVDYLFRGGPPSPCFEEGDVNGDGSINVADLTYLVDYLFRGGPPPPPCP